MGDIVVQYSKDLSKRGFFNEAHSFMVLCTTKAGQAKIYHEASRVSYVMGNYKDAIVNLQKAAHLEKNKNSNTFSDIGRCCFEAGNITDMEKDGLGMKSIE